MGRKSWQPDPGERVLLGLVRDRLDHEALAFCEPDALTGLALRHKVLTPMAALIEGDPSAPPDWKLWAARVALSSRADLGKLLAVLTRTLTLLTEAGIPAVVLKGPSLALGRLRDMGDADLLLPPGEIRRAIALLEDQGYRYQGFERNLRIRPDEYRDWDRLLRWSNQFEFTEAATGALVELHSALFEAGRVYDEDLGAFQRDPAPFLARSVAEGPFRFLKLEDRLLLLAVHVGVKRSPAARSFILRHVLDLAALTDAGPDWDEVLRRAGELECGHHLYLLLLLGRRYRPSFPFDRLISRLEEVLPTAAAGLVRLHADALRGPDTYDGPRLALWRLRAPFVFRGTPAARLRAALILPVFLLSPPDLAREYRVPGRAPWLPLLYLLEPFRLVGRAAVFLWRRIRGHR